MDKLTGISSFRRFIEETDKLLKDNPDANFDIFVWDIVKFKVINDLYGMEAGDWLLKEIATEIKSKVVRGTCGRIGNDKFVCCVFADDRLYDFKNNVYEFRRDGVEHRILIQGGCYQVRTRDIPVIKMCDRAILALDSIKGKYTEAVAIYDNSEREDIIMGQRLAADFDNALKERQFKVYIQPIYYADSNVMAGGEVLVRWEHPTLGFLSPGRFIGYFEQNYLITRLDKFVWEEACRMLKKMKEEGRTIVPLSINVSRTDFLYDDLYDVLVGLVTKYDVEPDKLKIEITESAYIDNPVRIKDTIDRLCKYGFNIHIDDFGTGYSSLNTLRELPFGILKIDKALIDEIDGSEKAANVVSTIISMAKWLGMDVIAEGVEKVSQLNFLRHMGCKYIQGFYFSKPVCEDDFFKKDFESSTVIEDDTDRINVESIFAIRNPESRGFVDRMLGAILQYEIDEGKLVLKRVNQEFYRLYDIKTPYELFTVRKGNIIEEKDVPRVYKRCINAMTRNEPLYIETSCTKNDGSKGSLYVRIFYIGKENGKPQFLFNSMDITKENRKRVKQRLLDYMDSLSKLCEEILRLNYTDNTLTTVHCNEDKVRIKYDNTPLDRALDRFSSIIDKDEHDEVMKVFSYEEMEKFCLSNESIKVINLHLSSKTYGRHMCEIIIINNRDEYGRIIVTTGSRVIL